MPAALDLPAALLLALLTTAIVRIHERLDGLCDPWPRTAWLAVAAIALGLELLTPPHLRAVLVIGCTGLVPIACSDLRTRTIWPDALLCVTVVVGVLTSLAGTAGQALSAGCAVGGLFLVTYLLTSIRFGAQAQGEGAVAVRLGRWTAIVQPQARMGLGDVEMAFVVGLVVGSIGVLWTLLLCALTLLSTPMLAGRRRFAAGPLLLAMVPLAAIVAHPPVTAWVVTHVVR